MQITLHQTNQTIADFKSIFSYIKNHFNQESEGLHIFPELFLTGYPLQDLCLQKSFIESYLTHLENLKDWLSKNINSNKVCLIFGGLEYQLTQNGLPLCIKNCAFQFGDGKALTAVSTKCLLPNYDIFDEKKYFTPGLCPQIINVFNRNMAILICEDMWASSVHHLDPVKELYQQINDQNLQLDAIINLSASPFYVSKKKQRLDRAKEISYQFGCPFIYVNKVGAEDEILFDGQSFIINGDDILYQSKRFLADIITTNLPTRIQRKNIDAKISLTWEELFSAKLVQQNQLPTLKPLADDDCQEILEGLCFAIQEYAKKNGFSKFSIALSGGMDSALVLAITRISLTQGQELEAIYMPSVYSSPLSHELSLNLCKNLGVPFTSLPIKFLHSASKNLFEQTFTQSFTGLTDENIQARLRGLLIYTRSNQIQSMVINTSNKSEIAVGYSTQYGDSVGAISMLGDLYKSEVYRLAEYVNIKYNNIIPQEILTRPPSAELRPNQIDEQTLPPYSILDAILEGILSYRHSLNDLVQMGFSKEHVEATFNLYRKNEYKRYQFCPIVKISSKSFGFGYRIPLSKDSNFYITNDN